MTGADVASLIGSEFRKVATTKVLLILSLAAGAWVVLNVLLAVLLAGAQSAQMGQPDAPSPLLDPAYVTNVIGSTGSASVFALIIGILAMSGEYRNLTITSTFLVSPRRWRVLVAKAAAYAAIGAALAVVLWLVVIALVSLLFTQVEAAPIDWRTAFEILGGSVLGLMLYAVLGVAIGALITSQVIAIIVALVWVLLVEALLTVFVDWLGKWLPGGALNAVLQTTNTSGFGGTDVLSPGAGALLLIAYSLVLGGIAAATTIRRDIT